MRFIVQTASISPIALKAAKTDVVHLIPDNWDDNFKFKTSFRAVFYSVKAPNKPIELGGLRILKLHQEEGTSTLNLLKKDRLLEFDELSPDYCSLAWGEDFYKKLEGLGLKKSVEYLEGINDIYHAPSKADKFNTKTGNPGFSLSLLRDSFAAYLFREAQKREASQQADNLKFDVSIKLKGADVPHTIDFDFTPHNGLPNRIFVLVGKNGVGKTQIMGRLGIKLSGFERDMSQNSFEKDKISERGLFKNILAVSFNAFDDFEIPPSKKKNPYRSYKYWGLRQEENKIVTTDSLLDTVFSLMSNQSLEVKKRFDRYVSRIVDDAKLYEDRPLASVRHRVITQTSAGQKFLIVTIAGLLCFLQKNSLLLFDEPETHLHPSFLTTLISIMGEILEENESYAIISTHSPIVLQQIPSRYIRCIKRYGNTPEVSPIPIESFGENLTEISQKVFDVNEKEKDFTDIFLKLLESHANDATQVAEVFDGKLGISATTILYSLANKKRADA